MTIPQGGGFLVDVGRPVSPQNGFGEYFDATKRVPSYLFIGNSLASQTPNEPSITLVANGGAQVAQAFPVAPNEGEPLESPLMISGYQYTNAGGVFHEIADTSILNIDGTQSWAISVAFRTLNDAFPAAAGAITGKRVIGGTEVGWELTLGTNGSVTLTWKGDDLIQKSLGFSTYNSVAGQHRYADGRWHTFDVEFDAEAKKIRVGNEHESTMEHDWVDGVPGTVSDLSTATTYRLGAVRAFAAGPIQIAYLAASQDSQSIKGDPSNTAIDQAVETSLVQVLRHVNEPIT